MTFPDRIKKMSRELKLFAAISLLMGMTYSIYESTFNNYLNDKFALSGFQRSLLELPRELPGVLTVFITAIFSFLSSRRLGVVALLFTAVGAILVGYASPTYGALLFCLFVYSIGQHLFIPLSASIGMELAHEGQTGRRLGQLNAIRNFATIIGSFLVFLGFRFFAFRYQHSFLLAAVGLTTAALLMFLMKPKSAHEPKTFLKLHREYRLYYILNFISGSRKQIFLTFGPWVIVSIYHQPTQVIATLMTIGGVIGILFQPILGRAIDRFGEKRIMQIEAVLLVVVCLGYGFSGFLFSEKIAFYLTCVFYLLDQMLMSVNMARSMFMKKIALQESDIQPALTTGVTIDHVFSFSVALLGGVIWNTFGFQYVFLIGVVIAAGGLIAASRIHLPVRPLPVQPNLDPQNPGD